MAVFQIESDVCTGRGFVDTSPSGYCKKFYDWITKAPAAGGPGWTILRDKSASPTGMVASGVVANTIYCSGHGFFTGDFAIYHTTGTVMGGLQNDYTYCIRKMDNNNIQIAYDAVGAHNRYAISTSGTLAVTSSGTGVHTFTLNGPYIVVSNEPSPQVNQSCHIMTIGYLSAIGSQVRVQHQLGYDSVLDSLGFVWDGHYITTLDSSDFAYDFRGGDECMILQSRIGTTWYSCGTDTWTGDGNLLEGVDKSGVLMSGVLSGSGIVLNLNNSGAYNFTSGEYYYLCDFQNNHNWATYTRCTSVNGPANQITIESGYYNYPSGSIIAAYPYRYLSFGTTANNAGFVIDIQYSNGTSSIPLNSSKISGYVIHNGNGPVYTRVYMSQANNYISTMSPNDKNQYALEKMNVMESNSPNYVPYYVQSPVQANRAYGSCNNILIAYLLTMAKAQDGRSYAGKNYLYFQQDSSINLGGTGNNAALFLDTESLV